MSPKPSHTPYPVKLADFALRARRAKSSISQAIRGPLADAVTPDRRLDLAHPVAVAWLTERGISLDQMRQYVPRRPKGATPPRPSGDPHESPPGETLAQTIAANPTQEWLSARKTIADIRRIELGVTDKQRTLISRELVATHMARALDALERHVHDRAAVAIVAALRKAIASDATAEQQLLIVRDVIGSHLKAAKAQVIATSTQESG